MRADERIESTWLPSQNIWRTNGEIWAILATMPPLPPVRGRGTAENPPNRFERIHVAADPDEGPAPPGEVPTEFYRDATRSVISHNDSPDIGFDFSLNPYRGCEHGCVYCYARPFHEFLGL